MVLSGKKWSTQAVSTGRGETIRCFRKTVTTAVPGIVFLSGGQDDVPATVTLNEDEQDGPASGELSFSYGRALQAPALNAWKGDQSNVDAGQQALLHLLAATGRPFRQVQRGDGAA